MYPIGTVIRCKNPDCVVCLGKYVIEYTNEHARYYDIMAYNGHRERIYEDIFLTYYEALEEK